MSPVGQDTCDLGQEDPSSHLSKLLSEQRSFLSTLHQFWKNYCDVFDDLVHGRINPLTLSEVGTMANEWEAVGNVAKRLCRKFSTL
jgi:hypothetical protein